MNVIVVGCGVSGLSCGIRLLEAGYDVQIWARDLPPHTTSNIAAAIWYPYKAYPEALVGRWAAIAYAEFIRLTQEPEAGVLMRSGMEVFPTPVADPWWRDALPSFRRATPSELPNRYQDAYVFDVPVIEMPMYLRYLMARFQRLGGVIVRREVQSFEAALERCNVLVNCSGLRARELVGDTTLFAIRGQIVRVAQVGIERFLLDDHGPSGVTYIVPRSHDIVLGGTTVDGDESLQPDPATASAIIERCAAFEPRLRDAVVLEHRVGLRPGRPAVRLEAEEWPHGKLVIHNYGHGGAGVTLSWGCATDTLALAQRVSG